MALTGELDHFEGEDCIITFEKEWQTGNATSAQIYNVEGQVMNWNISGGNQPTEDVFAFGNKTFNFQKPREKFTLSFEVMLADTNMGFVQFGSFNSADNMQSDVKLIMSDRANARWRVIFWFQDSANHIANTNRTVIVPSKTAPVYRMMFVDVKSVTFDKEFSADEYMKGTLTSEFSSTDENGNPNYIEQEGIQAGTASTILASMTTTANDAASNVGLLIKARGYILWNTTTPSWTAGTTTTRYRFTG